MNDLVNGPSPNEAVVIHTHRQEPVRLDGRGNDVECQLLSRLIESKHGEKRAEDGAFHVGSFPMARRNRFAARHSLLTGLPCGGFSVFDVTAFPSVCELLVDDLACLLFRRHGF